MNPRGPAAAKSKGAEAEEGTPVLTPTFRRDLAAQALLKAIDAYVGVLFDTRRSDDEWVDQNASPLGKFAHMQAVRQGRLAGVKHGKLILVRRSDLNSYLAKHSVKHRSTTTTSEGPVDTDRASEVAAAVLTHVGLRQRKG
jgi:hypothetical protein